MHTALSFQRVHAPKRYNLAHYHPETNMAYTVDPKGPLFKTMGKVFSKQDPLGLRDAGINRLWLLPEEILYLLERGTIDVRWPADDGEGEDLGVPMSLQGAYAAFIGREEEVEGALTFERYSVYAGLKRMGYIVHRAPSWDGPGDAPGEECMPPLPVGTWSLGLMVAKWRDYFTSSGPASEKQQEQGPVVFPGLYRSYGVFVSKTMKAWANWCSSNLPTACHHPRLRPNNQERRSFIAHRSCLPNHVSRVETRLEHVQEE